MKFAAIISLTMLFVLSNTTKNTAFAVSKIDNDTIKKTVAGDSIKTGKRIAVDSRGRALDTDGDKVPDYKDKELLTPQSCFPVDSTGIGICPATDCCKGQRKN